MNNSKGPSISSIAALSAVALVACVAVGCQKPSDSESTTTTNHTSTTKAVDTVAPVAAAEKDASAHAGTNWFGGPIYSGEPALAATAALIKAGGGIEKFSFHTALVSMLGEKTVNGEVAKLTKQYGADQVKVFIDGMDFAVKDAAKLVAAKGIKLPDAPSDLTGVKLAKALVEAGTTPDGTFWSGYLFDKALSHDIHMMTMGDIDHAVGHAADETTHKILNQAMYDVAQALGMKDVKIATLH